MFGESHHLEKVASPSNSFDQVKVMSNDYISVFITFDSMFQKLDLHFQILDKYFVTITTAGCRHQQITFEGWNLCVADAVCAMWFTPVLFFSGVFLHSLKKLCAFLHV